MNKNIVGQDEQIEVRIKILTLDGMYYTFINEKAADEIEKEKLIRSCLEYIQDQMANKHGVIWLEEEGVVINASQISRAYVYSGSERKTPATDRSAGDKDTSAEKASDETTQHISGAGYGSNIIWDSVPVGEEPYFAFDPLNY